MPQPEKSPKNFHTPALMLHGVMSLVAFALLLMFVPVVLGEVSGEGAGMGVFLLLYFLGIPLAIGAAVATVFSIHSPRPGLLLPTALLWLGAFGIGATGNNLAVVVFSTAYIAAVGRAVFLTVRAQTQPNA